MENILPIEAYYRRAQPPRWSLFLIFGAVVGTALMAIYLASEGLDPNSPSTGEIGPEILWGVAGGLVLGALMRLLVRVKLKGLVWRVYEGILAFKAPEPQEAGYTHKLPAILAPAGSWKIAGVLYAGPGRLVFVPQRGSLLGGREPRPIPLGRDVRFTPGVSEPTPLVRFLGPPPQPTLEIETGGSSWLLLIPDAEAVAATLRSIVLPGIRG